MSTESDYTTFGQLVVDLSEKNLSLLLVADLLLVSFFADCRFEVELRTFKNMLLFAEYIFPNSGILKSDKPKASEFVWLN